MEKGMRDQLQEKALIDDALNALTAYCLAYGAQLSPEEAELLNRVNAFFQTESGEIDEYIAERVRRELGK